MEYNRENNTSINDDSEEISDVHMLMKSWINERCSPDILPYNNLVNDLLEQLEVQSEIIEANKNENVNAAFQNMLCQQEMDRVKFIIKNYLRTRLQKIEKYANFIYENKDTYYERLSDKEITYCEQYKELVDAHLLKSSLETAPAFLRELNGKNMKGKSIRPILDEPVFCRIKEDIGNVQIQGSQGSSESVYMEKNNIFMLRYKSIESFLEEGKAELL
ncbi:GINS complex, Sld5 component [Neocallimastix lanati (nom. inval.)]|jgi:GINS complex subunit 4|uniref:DNA replication complex GINS protein SLD5 n=1 Tax=Neocallimastix californiae TaxID=1754190 RepID=A0A1Y2CGW0_9FUNG|nr:GINS complex, Sld5 component [Neocallimastix sp. JGI-2020a]ORY46166.1 GINS complex, Sld5 component [Neocallimastix californiae]|eukprot:ORY46166.1 GINS complex, Sld5 component [Neocallimastix californiae]